MRNRTKKIINKLLGKFGLEIIRKHEKDYLIEKYNELIKECVNFFKELIFQDLPECEKRINLLGKLYGTQVSEAMYVINYLHKALKLDGDVCEFGVGNGATSTLLANEIRKVNKKIWFFDSFKGLSKPSEKDILKDDIFNLETIDKYEGTMNYSSRELKSRLKTILFPKSRTKIIEGFIENTINNKNLPKSICFAYVDFDLYSPISITLEYLDKFLIKGGYIIIDDYDFFSEGVKTAVDEFLKKYKNKYMQKLPYEFAGHFCILNKK